MAQEQKVFPPPVDWDELYPGRFIKASEFKGKQVTLRISAVRIEELIGDKGPRISGVISFEKTEKQWAINRTNGICCRAMFGTKVQEWVGKRVTLFPGMHDGEACIRVWGSPDIDKDFDVLVSLPRKRPFTMTMHRTGTKAPPPAAAATRPAAATPPAREPGADDEPVTLSNPDYDPELSRELDRQLSQE